MNAEARSIGTGAAGSDGFAPFHGADKAWFPGLLALLWLALLAGFVPETIRHATANTGGYMPILHVHAILFVGWMVLLTTQSVLIRRQQVAVHRRLGQIGVLWAPVMVVIGVITAFMVHRSRLGTPEWDPGFLAIQLGDLLEFSVFVGFALQQRRDPASHKRLMMLAAISLSNAGFGRFWGDFMITHLGNGFLGNWAVDYLSDIVILAAFLFYDTITRGRPHRVLVWGSALMAGTGLLAGVLYQLPAWTAFTGQLVRP